MPKKAVTEDVKTEAAVEEVVGTGDAAGADRAAEVKKTTRKRTTRKTAAVSEKEPEEPGKPAARKTTTRKTTKTRAAAAEASDDADREVKKAATRKRTTTRRKKAEDAAPVEAEASAAAPEEVSAVTVTEEKTVTEEVKKEAEAAASEGADAAAEVQVEAEAPAGEPRETAADAVPEGAADTIPQEKEAAEVKENEKRILLFVAAECQPFSGTGGLGEVAGSLPTALAASGKYDVTVVSPYYRDMPWEWKEKCEFVKYYYVKLAWRSQYCGIFRLVRDNVTYIFIDNEYYFGRTGLYGYYDDGERFAFFSKAVMDMMYELQYYPDIVHTNDWQAALIPVYNTYQYHYTFKSIFTIHNIAFQGQYSLDIFESVFDLPQEAKPALEYNGCVNLMKGAIECSHIVSTVSNSYVDELKEGFYSFNMEHIINRNAGKMRGILNGINYVAYDPENDPNIAAPFNAEDISGKAADKQKLQEMLGLTIDPDAPLIALISRLTSQKGLTLVRTVMENLLQERMQFVVLGVGEAEFEDYFRYLEDRYPGKVSTNIMFNGGLSHRIYAGADMFLMPSLTEPCGLAQMISCRYGTVPIIRETGGLKDSIKDCTYGDGNGFTFAGLDPYQLEDAVRRALALYANKEEWDKLRKYIMTIDFSWKKSAAEYDAMYDELF